MLFYVRMPPQPVRLINSYVRDYAPLMLIGELRRMHVSTYTAIL